MKPCARMRRPVMKSVETPTFSDEDIELVMSQAGCERDAAVKALSESNGEPAEAIIKLISG